MNRLTATVHGRVQGVGFRWYVVRQATRLRLTGWVANQPDGSVTVVAEGDGAALEQLRAALGFGPAGARVERVDGHLSPAAGTFAGFTIRSAGHSGD
jgi:acylphosphatase